MVQVDGLAVCKPLLCCVRPWPVVGSAEHVPFDPVMRESAAVAMRAAVAMPAERIVSAVCVGASVFWREESPHQEFRIHKRILPELALWSGSCLS